ncbi:MAG: nucleoside 2-deoxyribosyltransferase domain-containing protein [Candidatus Methanomethylophilaceae archaeon]|nr:nucleoside 2-deoxyribosyltransferase domain-containing protein [Candidatus Methanomethylophilaceae archaeon]
MKVLNPNTTTTFTELKDSVFLAGPCPRSSKQADWRDIAIKLFNKHGFTGDIINPTNRAYDDEYLKQATWEHRGLCLSTVIMFWIPRSEQHPAFTTNVEFGEWMHNDNVVLGFPKDSIKNQYLEIRFKEYGRNVYNDLEETVLATIDLIKNGWKRHTENIFFTSDTHFSQERTLELSYRPFRSIEEMDLQLISNWNKRLNSESIVFHLGDFGNFNILPLLNFKKMYFIKGNYEIKEAISSINDSRVTIVKPGYIKLNEKKFFLCHEPIQDTIAEFYLFGHIHRLQMVKRNGINVGVDANRFNPMSVKELEFLYGGVTKHYDENVFIDT